jgi:hypothetical protein
MIEPKWVSGDFIPQKFADALVEENIAGLTESDESDDEVFKFNRLIGSKNFSCFSKRSEMKSTLASAPNVSASITLRSIAEVADASDEMQYKSSHLKTNLSNIANKVTLHFSFLFVHNVMISGLI